MLKNPSDHPRSLALDETITQRFARDWRAITGANCAGKALIALSGGIDSTALLLLFKAISPTINPPAAATVDHGLRAASSAEAGVAADLCRSLGIGHAILNGELADRVGMTANLSARARALRYSLLEEHADRIGARWIVTAHHADDQLETLVMRVNRGSGVRGLAGIRRRADRIVRPLLGWRRDELAAVVAAHGVTPVSDPSNVDDRFDRARLRKQLAKADWLDARMAARSAAAMQDADETIEWIADRIEAEHCQSGGGEALLRPGFLPAELKRRLVERCLRQIDRFIDIRGSELTRLIERLEWGRPGTLGNVRCDLALARDGDVLVPVWTFRHAPPRR